MRPPAAVEVRKGEVGFLLAEHMGMGGGAEHQPAAFTLTPLVPKPHCVGTSGLVVTESRPL